ncbi:hypothetical protein [Bradyrhizobium sp.]|nr:hypothetical protein [Bradyrhizobium sp.]
MSSKPKHATAIAAGFDETFFDSAGADVAAAEIGADLQHSCRE